MRETWEGGRDENESSSSTGASIFEMISFSVEGCTTFSVDTHVPILQERYYYTEVFTCCAHQIKKSVPMQSWLDQLYTLSIVTRELTKSKQNETKLSLN